MSGALKLLERVIARSPGMSPDLAQHLLSMEFPPEDQTRYEELSEKAQLGTLTSDEESELDDFLDANDILAILQARARASLQKRSPAA